MHALEYGSSGTVRFNFAQIKNYVSLLAKPSAQLSLVVGTLVI